jgi:Fic family protein
MNDNIFSPQFNITPDTATYLEDIERQKWLVDNMLLMPKHEAWIRRDVQVKRASGTTRIEGATLDEDDVNRLINRGSVGSLTEDEQANVNALQAYEFIDFLSDQPDIPIDELAIREMNRIFIRGSSETLTPGVYRKGSNTVGNFTPPNAGDVPGLMRSFALWLREDRGNFHPIVKAGIAHLHFVAIHPFWDGNGRTARGLTTLILQRHGYGLKKLLSLESYLYEVKDQYFRTIEMTLGNSFSASYDATRWLDFFAYSIRDEFVSSVAQLTDWHRGMEVNYQRVIDED